MITLRGGDPVVTSGEGSQNKIFLVVITARAAVDSSDCAPGDAMHLCSNFAQGQSGMISAGCALFR